MQIFRIPVLTEAKQKIKRPNAQRIAELTSSQQ